MDIMICRHCRRPSDRPMIFSHGQQQVFDFIWDNPECDIDAIRTNAYITRSENHIAVLISQIRAILADTDYRLLGVGRSPTKYKIEKVPADANV